MEFFTSQTELVSYGASLLLKASVILALAWLLSMFLRKRSAGLRHVLWSVALGAVLALPLFSAWMPPLEVDMPRLAALSERIFPAPDEREGHVMEMRSGSAAQSGELADVPFTQFSPEPARSDAPARPRHVAGYLLGVWLAGFAGLSFVFLVHLVRIRRATEHAVPKARSQDLASEVAADLDIARAPRILVGQVEMPVTWGLLRPVVLLPVESTEWDERRLRIVLMHELAHIRRLDYLPHLLAELSCIVYWPNPLVWIARHRLRAEQELACDDVVLRTGTASHDYAELLLDIARTVQGRRLMPGGVRMAERKGLKARIQAILDPDVERDNVSMLAFAVVLVAVAVPALSAAALRSADAVPERGESASSADPGTTTAVEPGDTAAVPREAASPERPRTAAFTLTVEAERGRLAAPMVVEGDDRASGGRYVNVPDQEGHDPPDGGPGSVTFELDLRDSGAQAVWARAIGEHDNDNSFFVSVDGGEEFRWDVVDPEKRGHVKRWTWLPVTDPLGEPIRLEPGFHTLTFRNREDGSMLDAVFVTSDPVLMPMGRSPLPPPETSVSVAVEAEDAADFVAPFEIRTDRRASGRLYLSVADGFTSRRRAPDDGRATYRIDVPVEGNYVVWARAIGPDDDEDSFWIRANDDDWIRWNDIEDDDDWEWQLVHDSDDDDEIAVFPLRAGTNTLEIAYREDEARIDRFVVTNNMYAHPASRDAEEPNVTVTFSD